MVVFNSGVVLAPFPPKEKSFNINKGQVSKETKSPQDFQK